MLVAVVVLGLATWRLASMLATEEGPWSIFERLRRRIGIRRGDEGVPYAESELAKGLMCVWCNSVWIGAAMTIFYVLLGDVVMYLTMPLALSAVAVIVEGVASG